MMRPGTVATVVATTTLLVAPASADIVEVNVTGEVEFNQIGASPLGDVSPADPVSMTFRVDSSVFVDSGMFPTRGYEIIHDSFSVTMGPITIGLQAPFPITETPYFVLRDNDPAVDGFFLGNNVDAFPNGVPLDQTGIFEQFRMSYSTTYGNDPLPSLDILDAVGSYDFTGLTVFSMGVTDGPFDAMGMIFEQMTITLVCPEDINGDGVVNVLDLIDLLLCFGQPAMPGCEDEDVNGDGTVNVLDLIDLLLKFGTACE